MKKKITLVTLTILFVFGLSGCSHNRAYNTWSNDPFVKDTINQSINSMAYQLLMSSKIKKGDKVAIASFVDLHQLNKTSHFGRKISESFFNELHVRGFSVVDARGSKTFRVNADGEFFITRDIDLLKDKRIENSYILVGTYSKFGDGVLLNARIIDNITGDVVSTARSILHVNDCDLYENCNKKSYLNSYKPVPKVRTIGISDAGCSKVTCPTNCVTSSCYERTRIGSPIEPVVAQTPKNNLGCCK